MVITEYTDIDGYKYNLLPHKFERKEPTYIGCAFHFGNRNACMEYLFYLVN